MAQGFTVKAKSDQVISEALDIALRVLNGESFFGAKLQSKKYGTAKRFGCGGDPASLPAAKPEGGLLSEEVALRDCLRLLVDCWIDSGKVSGQGEFPRNRNLKARPGNVPYRRSSLQGIVDCRTRDRRLRSNESGELTFGLIEPLGTAAPERTSSPDANYFVVVRANQLFSVLVTSDFRFRIVQCRECRLYGYLSRPRIQYKLGYTCRKCKSAQTARSATEKARREAKQELLNPSAAFYATWLCLAEHKRKRYRDVQDYIAEKLRKAKFTVTRKWVSRHLPKIRKKGLVVFNGDGRG